MPIPRLSAPARARSFIEHLDKARIGNRWAAPIFMRGVVQHEHRTEVSDMAYYLATTIELPFDDAVARTREALQAEGFGVITEIDIQDTLKKKIGVDFRRYRILGACNPKLAYEALQLEDKVGTMLPCNVVVQEMSDGGTEVAAIDPVASMQAIENTRLRDAAGMVRSKLERVIDSLTKSDRPLHEQA